MFFSSFVFELNQNLASSSRPKPERPDTSANQAWTTLRQSKTKNVAARGNGNVLLAVHRVAHRRSMQRLPRVKVPQRLAALRVHGFKGLRVVRKKHQS